LISIKYFSNNVSHEFRSFHVVVIAVVGVGIKLFGWVNVDGLAEIAGVNVFDVSKVLNLWIGVADAAFPKVMGQNVGHTIDKLPFLVTDGQCIVTGAIVITLE
jgi:hypothetical protein